MKLGGRLAGVATASVVIVTFLTLLIAPPAEAKSVEVRLKDTFRFEPDRITAAPGESISLRLINDVTSELSIHSFTLFEERDASVPLTNDQDLQQFNATHDKIVDVWLKGPEETNVTFDAPLEPGTYTFVCMVSLHAVGGMHGVLVVEEEAAGIDPLTIGIVAAVVIVVVAVVLFMFLRRTRA